MHLTHLALTEFRSVRSFDVQIPEGGFGLIGANAAGKSTLFEAISLLATTRSLRAGVEAELLNWESGKDLGVQPYSRIEASLQTLQGPRRIEIGLQAEPLRTRRVRKVISLDGKRTTAGRVVGVLKCVLFEPQDIDLVSGSPSLRRRYLDVLLSQLDHGYLSALSRYNRIVEQRNSLIKSLVREGKSWQDPTVRSQLEYWDGELVAYGSRISHRRVSAVHGIDEFARARLMSFTGTGSMATTYIPATGVDDPHGAKREALLQAAGDSAAEMAFALHELLRHIRQAEFRRGVTLIGPHRDDVGVTIDDIDVGTFGSRGQQRLAAIALKLAEADVMFDDAGERPVVLLDDVFSELDSRHRSLLSGAINELGAQVIVSSTDLETLEASRLELPAIASMVNGSFSWTLPEGDER